MTPVFMYIMGNKIPSLYVIATVIPIDIYFYTNLCFKFFLYLYIKPVFLLLIFDVINNAVNNSAKYLN